MAKYITIKKTKAYNANNSPRDYIPAGVEFEGWIDGETKCRCSVDALPYLKKGWWVNALDVALVTVTEPPPVDPPPAGEVVVWPIKTMQLRNTVTGDVYQNEDPVTLTKSNG